MKIKLTKEILKRLPALYSNEDSDGNSIDKDPMVHVKFFNPCGSWSWFGIEYSDPAPDGIPRLFYGLMHGDEDELGYFSLDELESVKGPLGIGIELDRWFHPIRLSVLRAALDAGVHV